MRSLLPPSVSVVETTQDEPDAFLFAEERDAIGRAVPKRQREFATARSCARRALLRLGIPAKPIPSGTAGEPLWPAGIVGSITHCAGYRAAAVSRAQLLDGIGIDAELNEPVSAPAGGLIVQERERPQLEALAAAHPMIYWERLIFSAKEAAFKVWYPRTERWLEFDDAWVRFDPDNHFTVTIAPDCTLRGKWTNWSNLLLTAVAAPIPEVADLLRLRPVNRNRWNAR